MNCCWMLSSAATASIAWLTNASSSISRLAAPPDPDPTTMPPSETQRVLRALIDCIKASSGRLKKRAAVAPHTVQQTGSSQHGADGSSSDALDKQEVVKLEKEIHSYIDLLVSSGGNIDQRDVDSCVNPTALNVACQRGNYVAVKALLQRGADARLVESDAMICYTASSTYCLLLLVKYGGFDVNERDVSGCSLLIYAVKYARIDHVRVLLRLGANPKKAYREGNGAMLLFLSTEFFDGDMTQLFLEAGLETHEVDQVHGYFNVTTVETELAFAAGITKTINTELLL